jgi:hypothetical protein|tara:strand:+ start:2378 stop:2785 length:408 start_codon:yes stop_codon:yes gene_type:complete
MPYQVTVDSKALGESEGKTRREAFGEIKAINQGAAAGYIGEPPPSSIKKEEVVEELTKEEKQQKSELQRFLATVVEPPTVSSRTPPGKARQILLKKLNKMTLGELRRFWQKKIVPATASDEDKATIQNLWDEISP